MSSKLVVPGADDASNVSQLSLALGLAVGVALIMTCVSVAVYYGAGFHKFDLSRPGYEAERQNVTTNDSQKTYDTTTPVNAAAVDGFLSEYDANLSSMQASSDFNDSAVLSDDALLLGSSVDE